MRKHISITIDAKCAEARYRGIIFTSQIVGVINVEGKAEILLNNGVRILCASDYAEILKQIL